MLDEKQYAELFDRGGFGRFEGPMDTKGYPRVIITAKQVEMAFNGENPGDSPDAVVKDACGAEIIAYLQIKTFSTATKILSDFGFREVEDVAKDCVSQAFLNLTKYIREDGLEYKVGDPAPVGLFQKSVKNLCYSVGRTRKRRKEERFVEEAEVSDKQSEQAELERRQAEKIMATYKKNQEQEEPAITRLLTRDLIANIIPEAADILKDATSETRASYFMFVFWQANISAITRVFPDRKWDSTKEHTVELIEKLREIMIAKRTTG